MSKRDIISGYYVIWSSEMILREKTKKLQPSVRSVRYCRTLLSAWWVSGLYGEDGLWAAGQNTQTSISGIHHWMSALIRQSVGIDQKWSGNKCNKPRRTTTTTTSPAAVYFFYHYFLITSKFEELAHPICFAMWFQIKTLVFTCIITFNNRLTTHQVQFRLESTAGFNDPFFFAFLCNWVTCISQGLTCLTFQICELLRVTKCQLNWCGEH